MLCQLQIHFEHYFLQSSFLNTVIGKAGEITVEQFFSLSFWLIKFAIQSLLISFVFRKVTQYRCALSSMETVKGCSALTAVCLLIAACTKCQWMRLMALECKSTEAGRVLSFAFLQHIMSALSVPSLNTGGLTLSERGTDPCKALLSALLHREVSSPAGSCLWHQCCPPQLRDSSDVQSAK